MKKLFLIYFPALLFLSCTAVKFETPQPAGAPSLAAFPEKMRGTYTSEENDTLRIYDSSFQYSNGKEVNFTTRLDTLNLILKRVGDTYILNIKDEDGWDVIPVNFSRNRIIARYANLNSRTEPLILRLKKTAPVKEITTEDGKFDHYLIAPSDQEFKQLLRKRLFSEKTKFTRVK